MFASNPTSERAIMAVLGTDEYLVFVHLIEARGLAGLYVPPTPPSPLPPLAFGVARGSCFTLAHSFSLDLNLVMVCVELFLMSCCDLLLVLVCRSVPN